MKVKNLKELNFLCNKKNNDKTKVVIREKVIQDLLGIPIVHKKNFKSLINM